MKLKKEDLIFIIGGIIIILLLVIILILLEKPENEIIYKEDNNQVEVENSKNNSNLEIKDNKENTKSEETSKTDSKVNVTNKENKKEEVIPKQEKPKLENKQPENTKPEKVTYSQKDQKVINNLNDTLDKVNNTTNDANFSTKAKATFISIVDFLFYDGTINNVTFKELTTSGKQKVLEIASKIDMAIEKRLPGYKESISKTTKNAYVKASELIKKGATNVDTFLQNKLDKNDYDAIINAKEELLMYSKSALNFIGDVSSSLFNSSKNKLDQWYKNWKQK